MTAPPLYAPRFSFARVIADCWRVVAGAPLQLLGVLLLTAALTTLAALPWTRIAVRTPADVVNGLWVAVTTAKSAIIFIAISVETVLVTVVSLKVLGGLSWGVALRPRGLALGLATACLIQLPQYWPSLAEPVLLAVWPSESASGLLSLAGVIGYFAALTSVGIAAPVALTDQVGPPDAIARAFRLLQRLRWRIAAIGVAYLIVGAMGTLAVGLELSQAGLTFLEPGWGRAAFYAAPTLFGAVSSIALASVFMQARRVADGPSAAELEEVFA